MGGGKFEPNGQVTYAQFATMLDQAFFKDDVDSYGTTNPGIPATATSRVLAEADKAEP